jgi:hypothetical protein
LRHGNPQLKQFTVNAGCTPQGVGSCAELDHECSPQLLACREGGAIFWSNARRKLAVPTDDRVGLNHRETSPPTRPEAVQQNPQEPVAAVEAQATRPVLLENCKLVAKREDLRV